MVETTLDPECLEVLRRRDLLTGFVSAYLRDSPPPLDEMRRALGAGDTRACLEVAHRLRGSSGCLGALRLSDLCQELEALAKEDNLIECRRKLAELGTEYERVRAELRRLLTGHEKGRATQDPTS